MTAEPLVIQSPKFDKPLTCVGSYGDDRLIFSDLLDGVTDWIRKKIESDNQAVIIIRGGTGSGKSNLALQLIKRLSPGFTPDQLEDVYIYSPDDLAKKIKRGCTNQINWYDEGSVTFSNLSVMSKGGRLMGQFFDTMRLDHYISIICLPNDKEMDGRVSKHADLYLECPKYAPFDNFSPRGFFDVYKRTVYRSGKFFDEHYGTGIFRPVPKKLRVAYEEVKRAHAEEFKNKFVRTFLE